MNDPIEPEFHKLMNTLAELLDRTFNGHLKEGEKKLVGFCLLTFRFGEKARVNYISNAERGDMVEVMKNYIKRVEGSP